MPEMEDFPLFAHQPLAYPFLPLIEIEDVLSEGPADLDVIGWFRLASQAHWHDGFTQWYCLNRAWGAAQALSTWVASGASRGHDGAASIGVGSLVRLGRHEPVNGERNWAESMEPYVGRVATVVEEKGQDGQGCDVVKVDLDHEEYWWRVASLTPVTVDQLDELQREIPRRLALVYEEYGAAEPEKEFLEKLYAAGMLEVRMRLRFTYLLFQGSLQERDRAERILLTEGVPISGTPLAGDYTPELALMTAVAQLHQAGRHASVLQLLASRRQFLVMDEIAGPQYVHYLAAACTAVDETVHREVEDMLGASLAAWWGYLYDSLLDEEWGLDDSGVPLLARSAAVMKDRERLWRLLSLLFSSWDRRLLLDRLDAILTDFGLLLERSACRFAARIGSESYETLVEEGLQLVAEIDHPALVDRVVEIMLDLLETSRRFHHLNYKSRALLEEVFLLQRDWGPDRRPDLQARALFAQGDYEAAWAVFETLPIGTLDAEVEELLVECWTAVGGRSLQGRLTIDTVERLPERVQSSGLAAAAVEWALTAGYLTIDSDDPDGTTAALHELGYTPDSYELARISVPDGLAQLSVRALAHLGHVYRFIGDYELKASRIEYAARRWQVALDAWGAAIAQSVEQEKPHRSVLGRKGRLLREGIELHYRRLLQDFRRHNLRMREEMPDENRQEPTGQ